MFKKVQLTTLRKISQIFFLVLVFYLTYFAFQTPTAICWLCPLWHLQYPLVSKGTSLSLFIGVGWRPPEVSFFWLLGGFVLLGLILGRLFCSWVCPFGTLLERVELNSILKKPFEIKFFHPYLKYLVLVGTLILAFIYGEALFCLICPAGAIFKGLTNIVIFWALIIFALALALVFFFGWKAWCKYLCPLGGFLALLSLGQVFRIKITSKKCNNCLKCDKVCPVEVKVSTYIKEDEIKDPECIMCMACVDSCPKKALSFP